jgi:bidirectional [NiFe] hydrogenase diaphorase subunit
VTPEELAKVIAIESESQRSFAHTLNVCTAAGCMSLHSDQVKDALDAEVKRCGKDKQCRVRGVGCMGLCAAGPLVSVGPGEAMYQKVSVSDAPAVVEALAGAPVGHLHCPTDTAFFARQRRIVLENSGRIDPERIEEYLLNEGYAALLKVLTTMKSGDVIDEVTRSGLRGRGGAGFPTGLKWRTVAKATSKRNAKYVICNADEGDPGAFMDRSVLESDPHRVLEGMAIA